MKIRLLTVGDTSDRRMREAIDGYVKRAGHYIPFEMTVISDVKVSRSAGEAKQKEAEGEKILSRIQNGDRVILLDERGKEMSSREFATSLERLMATMQRDVIFVIGGPYGFSPAVYSRADSMLSLTRMTMTHEMVRLLFVEQVYRAMTIIRGEPYHHD